MVCFVHQADLYAVGRFRVVDQRHHQPPLVFGGLGAQAQVNAFDEISPGVEPQRNPLQLMDRVLLMIEAGDEWSHHETLNIIAFQLETTDAHAPQFFGCSEKQTGDGHPRNTITQDAQACHGKPTVFNGKHGQTTNTNAVEDAVVVHQSAEAKAGNLVGRVEHRTKGNAANQGGTGVEQAEIEPVDYRFLVIVAPGIKGKTQAVDVGILVFDAKADAGILCRIPKSNAPSSGA